MTVHSLGEIDITTWVFRVLLVGVSVLLVAGLGLVMHAHRLRHRHRQGHRLAGRSGLAGLALVLLLANVAAGVNASYDYFRTLGDVVGLPPSDEFALAELLARRSVPADGVVTTVTVPPRASGFAARDAMVWVPPAFFARPRPVLPVVVLLHGSPGTPQDWLDGGQAGRTADAWARTHDGRAPILVMPDVNGTVTADSECVDSGAVRAETYLTVDVPAFVREVFHPAPQGRRWAVAGLSEGGSCALVLALRHPGQFGTFGDYAGLAGPRLGETNADTGPTIAALFGGSTSAFAAHEPASLLAGRRYPGLGGWFEVGEADPEPAAAQSALVPAARRAGILTCAVVVPGGGHAFDVFSSAFADSLPWIAGRVGAGPPVSDPRCAA